MAFFYAHFQMVALHSTLSLTENLIQFRTLSNSEVIIMIEKKRVVEFIKIGENTNMVKLASEYS